MNENGNQENTRMVTSPYSALPMFLVSAWFHIDFYHNYIDEFWNRNVCWPCHHNIIIITESWWVVLSAIWMCPLLGGCTIRYPKCV